MSIVDHARSELERINFGADDTAVMLSILRTFFGQWDSGAAVAAVQPILNKCIAGKPLSPLTGDDDEWMEVSDGVFQNLRCSTVFKTDGRCYDIDTPGRPTITFPYTPKSAEVRMPLFEIQSPEETQGE
jgi:hypothetical protein